MKRIFIIALLVAWTAPAHTMPTLAEMRANYYALQSTGRGEYKDVWLPFINGVKYGFFNTYSLENILTNEAEHNMFYDCTVAVGIETLFYEAISKGKKDNALKDYELDEFVWYRLRFACDNVLGDFATSDSEENEEESIEKEDTNFRT